MDNNKSSSSIGLTLLTILFIYLKLTNQISWSWLWVLAPMWAPLVLLGVFLITLIISGFIKQKSK